MNEPTTPKDKILPLIGDIPATPSPSRSPNTPTTPLTPETPTRKPQRPHIKSYADLDLECENLRIQISVKDSDIQALLQHIVRLKLKLSRRRERWMGHIGFVQAEHDERESGVWGPGVVGRAGGVLAEKEKLEKRNGKLKAQNKQLRRVQSQAQRSIIRLERRSAHHAQQTHTLQAQTHNLQTIATTLLRESEQFQDEKTALLNQITLLRNTQDHLTTTIQNLAREKLEVEMLLENRVRVLTRGQREWLMRRLQGEAGDDGRVVEEQDDKKEGGFLGVIGLLEEAASEDSNPQPSIRDSAEQRDDDDDDEFDEELDDGISPEELRQQIEDLEKIIRILEAPQTYIASLYTQVDQHRRTQRAIHSIIGTAILVFCFWMLYQALASKDVSWPYRT